MNILITNYRYFVSGGPERYMFNAINALEQKGHDVIPFSIRYNRNTATPYEHYFVDPLSSPDEIYFNDLKKNVQTVLKTLNRLFYSSEVEQAVHKIAMETKPQIAYVLHYLRKLSPSLLVGLKKAGLPIAVRLSDYAMLCPQSHCLRNGKPCEYCITGRLWPSIRYGCVQKNKTISLLNALATYYHRHKKLFNLIDAFIVTNEFMYDMMVKADYPASKLHCIPTFTDIDMFRPDNKLKRKIITYVGRVEHIKGVHVFLDAIDLLNKNRPGLLEKAIIVGSGEETYSDEQKKNVKKRNLENIVTFTGNLSSEKLAEILRLSALSIVPSLWYENMPNSVLESYASGVPVLASDIGSLKSLVKNGKTGYLFPTGDAESLSERISFCLDNFDHTQEMGKTARNTAETLLSQ